MIVKSLSGIKGGARTCSRLGFVWRILAILQRQVCQEHLFQCNETYYFYNYFCASLIATSSDSSSGQTLSGPSQTISFESLLRTSSSCAWFGWACSFSISVLVFIGGHSEHREAYSLLSFSFISDSRHFLQMGR